MFMRIDILKIYTVVILPNSFILFEEFIHFFAIWSIFKSLFDLKALSQSYPLLNYNQN